MDDIRGSGSEITNLEAYQVRGTRYPWVFLRIDTDQGIHGWGQVSTGPHGAVVAAATSRLGPILIGENPTRIEFLWHKLYVHVSDAPGLGHELREDALAEAIPF